MMRYARIGMLALGFHAYAATADTIPEQPWGLVNVSVANVRTEPRHGAELSTQTLLGTPVRLNAKTDNGWYKAVLPDGYTGYIIGNSLVLKSDDDMARWRNADRVTVIAPSEIRAYTDSATLNCELIVSDLVPTGGPHGYHAETYQIWRLGQTHLSTMT